MKTTQFMKTWSVYFVCKSAYKNSSQFVYSNQINTDNCHLRINCAWTEAMCLLGGRGYLIWPVLGWSRNQIKYLRIRKNPRKKLETERRLRDSMCFYRECNSVAWSTRVIRERVLSSPPAREERKTGLCLL